MDTHAWTAVSFHVQAAVKPGEQVVLCGSAPALGSFAPSKGITLVTSPEAWPEWRTPAPLALPRGVALTYRYAVFTGGKISHWEYLEGDRDLLVTHESMAVHDQLGVLAHRSTLPAYDSSPAHSAGTFVTATQHSSSSRPGRTWRSNRAGRQRQGLAAAMAAATASVSSRTEPSSRTFRDPSHAQGRATGSASSAGYDASGVEDAGTASDDSCSSSSGSLGSAEETHARLRVRMADHQPPAAEPGYRLLVPSSANAAPALVRLSQPSQSSRQGGGQPGAEPQPSQGDAPSAPVYASTRREHPSVRLRSLLQGRAFVLLHYHLPVIITREPSASADEAAGWRARWDDDNILARSPISVARTARAVWVGCLTRRAFATPAAAAAALGRAEADVQGMDDDEWLSLPPKPRAALRACLQELRVVALFGDEAVEFEVDQDAPLASATSEPTVPQHTPAPAPAGPEPVDDVLRSPIITPAQLELLGPGTRLGMGAAALDAIPSPLPASAPRSAALASSPAQAGANEPAGAGSLSAPHLSRTGSMGSMPELGAAHNVACARRVTKRTASLYLEYCSRVLRPVLHNVMDTGASDSVLSTAAAAHASPAGMRLPEAPRVKLAGDHFTLGSPALTVGSEAPAGQASQPSLASPKEHQVPSGTASASGSPLSAAAVPGDSDLSETSRGFRLRAAGWKAYIAVNSYIAAALVRHVLEPGMVVWTHGFEFAMVPQFLAHYARPRPPQVLFWHSPFPTSEVFRTLAERERLLAGMLHADLVGFHTFNHGRHFLQSVKRTLGVNYASRQGGRLVVDARGRDVVVAISHMGVDTPIADAQIASHGAALESAALRAKHGRRVIIAGVDRAERLSGVVLKLLAFEVLLQDNPAYAQKLVLVQRLETRGVRRSDLCRSLSEVQELSQRINSRFGAVVDVEQVHVLSVERRMGLFHAADVLFHTPVREGFNLMPLQYVYIRTRWEMMRLQASTTGAPDTPQDSRSSAPQRSNTEGSAPRRPVPGDRNFVSAPSPAPGAVPAEAASAAATATAARTSAGASQHHTIGSAATVHRENKRASVAELFSNMFSTVTSHIRSQGAQRPARGKGQAAKASALVGPTILEIDESAASDEEGKDVAGDQHQQQQQATAAAAPPPASLHMRHSSASAVVDHATPVADDQGTCLDGGMPTAAEVEEAKQVVRGGIVRPLAPPRRAGIVVLSEFTTASNVLNGAVVVNPWNVSRTAASLDKALNSSAEDRMLRVMRDFLYATRNPSYKWARNILLDLMEHVTNRESGDFVEMEQSELLTVSRKTTLGGVGPSPHATPGPLDATPRLRVEPAQRESPPLDPVPSDVAGELLALDLARTSEAFAASRVRICVLDYGGTVLEREGAGTYMKYEFWGSHSKRRSVPEPVLQHIRTLASMPSTLVVVASSLSAAALSRLPIATCAGVTLCAENGGMISWSAAARELLMPGSSEQAPIGDVYCEAGPTYAPLSGPSRKWWRAGTTLGDGAANLAWRSAAARASSVMQEFVWRVNGSVQRDTGSAIVWDFRESDPEWGTQQARVLARALARVLPASVKASMRKSRVEVAPSNVSKGLLLSQLLALLPAAEFVLAVGDDAADEDMFSMTSSAVASAAAMSRGLAAGSESSCLLGSAEPSPAALEAAPASALRTACTVTVGRKKSHARYFLHDVPAVHALLRELVASSAELAGQAAGV